MGKRRETFLWRETPPSDGRKLCHSFLFLERLIECSADCISQNEDSLLHDELVLRRVSSLIASVVILESGDTRKLAT